MELKNFGGVLSFAAELEAEHEAFYRCAAENPACGAERGLFGELAGEHKQNEQRILRVRRENVTEMVLEPIKDFAKAPFVGECGGADRMKRETVVETARKIEGQAERFYREAAEKIRGLPEVAGQLRLIGKKHSAHAEKLAQLS